MVADEPPADRRAALRRLWNVLDWSAAARRCHRLLPHAAEAAARHLHRRRDDRVRSRLVLLDGPGRRLDVLVHRLDCVGHRPHLAAQVFDHPRGLLRHAIRPSRDSRGVARRALQEAEQQRRAGGARQSRLEDSQVNQNSKFFRALKKLKKISDDCRQRPASSSSATSAGWASRTAAFSKITCQSPRGVIHSDAAKCQPFSEPSHKTQRQQSRQRRTPTVRLPAAARSR